MHLWCELKHGSHETFYNLIDIYACNLNHSRVPTDTSNLRILLEKL